MAMATPTAVARAGERRQALHAAMDELEGAVARPTAGAGWLDRVEEGLVAVKAGLEAHIEEVEASDGLLAEIIAIAPRLSADVMELEDEHLPLLLALHRTERGLQAARKGGDEERNALRRRATTLLGRLTVHRQHGSDLVFEAYNMDIEAAD
jgi:hypothetical protein